MPDLRVRGRVLDAETGQPIADARVFLQTGGVAGAPMLIPIMTDPAGRFEFAGVVNGEQSLRVVKQS